MKSKDIVPKYKAVFIKLREMAIYNDLSPGELLEAFEIGLELVKKKRRFNIKRR